MKKFFKRISAAVIALAVMVAAVVFDVPEKIAAAEESGTSDDGLMWTLDDSGTLTISGSGTMADYSWQAIGQKSSAPWGGYKTRVTAIVIGNGVKSIGNFAFYNLTSVETISIADSVTSIGTNVFRDCSKIETIVIPSSVTTIGMASFQKCTSLKSISIPESVMGLGSSVFDDCTDLLEVTIPGSLKFISNSTFRNCTSLKSVTIPSTVTSIGDYAFINCSNLTSIGIPSGVTSIGSSAFSGCGNLTSITIPSGVTSIGNNAFKDCAALNTATLECVDPPTLGSNAFSGAAVGNIYVPCGVVEAYKTADNWSEYASVIENDGHKVAEHITAKEPTCTEAGNTEYWACGCGEYKYSNADGSAEATDVIIAALSHDYGDWTITSDPTIDTTGTAERICSNNISHKDTATVPALTDLSWTKTETTKPTITGTGSYTYESEDYGTVTVTVPKLTDTVWTKDAESSTEPSINSDGSYTYTSDYGTVTVTVPKLTDTVWAKDAENSTEPSINSDGSYTYTSDYGTVTVIVPKLSDTSVWKNTQHVDATEDKPGKDVYTSVYGEVEVTLDPTGHTLTHVPEVPATETTEGTKEHWHCEGCNKNFADKDGATELTNLTIPPLGHTHTLTHIPDVPATETAEGTKEHWHCNGCGNDFADKDGTTELTDLTIPKLTHTHTLTHIPEVPATETAEGTKEHWHCEGCGNDFADKDGTTELTDLTIPKLTHTHTLTHIPEVPATETAEGTKEHWHCEGCGNDFADKDGTTELTDLTIPKLTHTHTLTHIPEVPATETAEGTKEHWHCEGCNKDFADENGATEITNLKIPVIGHKHDLTHVEEVPATETTEGTKEHWHCGGCNKDFADENGATEITNLKIPVIGHKHDLTHVEEVPATETAEGVKEHWHCGGCNKDFADANGENEVTADDLRIGNIKKEVQSGANAPTATLTTPEDKLANAVLTDEEKAIVSDGKDIRIVLKIDVQSEPAPEDKTAVETAIGGLDDYKLGQYLDISLFKVIDGEENQITETKAALTITFEVPAGLRGSGRTYSVIRVHDGKTTVLEDKDNNPDTVTVETDKFSIYALAYHENTTSSTPSGGGSGSSGGSGGRPSSGSGSGSATHTTPTVSDNSDTTPSGSDTTSGDENTSAGDNGSDTTSGGNDTSGGDENSSSEDNGSDTTSSGNDTSSGESNSSTEVGSSDSGDPETASSEDTSSANESLSTDESDTNSSDGASSSNASTYDPSESGSSESGGNPATGIAISVVPLAAAFAVAAMTIKRKR